MQSFHINPRTGEPGLCKAEVSCPFGGPAEHHPTLAAAREAYEASMQQLTLPQLQRLSEERSEWRSLPWAERKAILEAGAKELLRRSTMRRKWRFHVEWVEDFEEQGLLGLSHGMKGKPKIVLPEKRLELVEYTAAMEDIVHEIAHRGKEASEHEESWRAEAQRIAASTEIAWHDFPEGSQLSPQEAFRLNHLWLSQRVPKFQGVCEVNPAHREYSKGSHERMPNTVICYFCDEAGEDGYLRFRWSPVISQEDRDRWIFDKMNEQDRKLIHEYPPPARGAAV